MPNPNRALLMTTLKKCQQEAAKGNDGLWRQEFWTHYSTCGTSHCFGGWTLILSGHEISRSRANVVVDGERLEVHIAARKLLGITPTQATRLFRAVNSIADLERLVCEIVCAADEE